MSATCLKRVPLRYSRIYRVQLRSLIAPSTPDKGSVLSISDYTTDPLPGKKDTSGPLPSAYNPEFVEKDWYAWWLHKGLFVAENASNEVEKFVLLLPPPNVTGVLHLGHALTISIQDALVRWHRMQGHKTLFVPGTDHAGIGTQVMVEKMLWATKKETRHDVGRDKFVSTVWDWKEEKGAVIKEQMSRLGASFDWSKEFFTLDNRLSQAVTDAFIYLYEKKKIYRDTQLVNWCCSLQSSISDIEVDDVKLDKPTTISVPGYKDGVKFGVLSSFAYPVHDSHEEIVVSTTRLETMLGDTAVAIHPDDTRYSHLIGRKVWHPLCSRIMPIVADPFVDRNFGSGAVKLTPGHSYTDFEVARRHDLAVLNIIDDKGSLCGEAGKSFTGMPRFVARDQVRLALQNLGLYRGEEPHAMILPLCSRSGDVIEPRLREQWFLNCKEMADQAVQLVEQGHLTFSPPYHKAAWVERLTNIREWCVSRQVWWGHRIPAYRFQMEDRSVWVVARSKESAVKKFYDQHPSCTYLSCTQDEDVLDTWFSSGLLPFAIFGWPQKTEDLKEFYPLSLMETGQDILFFWVARMVMLGLELTGHLPFRHVLLHGIIRDEEGRKMSKSLGNVIDPMDVICGVSQEQVKRKESSVGTSGVKDEASCGRQIGADALRFTLCSYNFKADEVRVSVPQIQANSFFCNKIWQAFRFMQHNLGADFKPLQQLKLSGKDDAVDLWILSRVSELVAQCKSSFVTHDLQKITVSLRTFWIANFCDVYLERCKGIFQQNDVQKREAACQVLYHVVHTFLRLLAPFMPFLAEELFQRLPAKETHWPESICIASYPLPEEYPWQDEAVESTMELVQTICNRILSVRHANGVTKAAVSVHLIVGDQQLQATLGEYLMVIKRLTKADPVQITDPSFCPVDRAAIVVNEKVHLLVDMQVDNSKELERLSLKREKVIFSKDKVTAKLTKLQNKGKDQIPFATKLQEKEALLEAELRTIADAINSLGKLQDSKS